MFDRRIDSGGESEQGENVVLRGVAAGLITARGAAGSVTSGIVSLCSLSYSTRVYLTSPQAWRRATGCRAGRTGNSARWQRSVVARRGRCDHRALPTNIVSRIWMVRGPDVVHRTHVLRYCCPITPPRCTTLLGRIYLSWSPRLMVSSHSWQDRHAATDHWAERRVPAHTPTILLCNITSRTNVGWMSVSPTDRVLATHTGGAEIASQSCHRRGCAVGWIASATPIGGSVDATKGRRKTTISHDVYTFLTWRCLTSPHKGREQWN